MLSIGVVQIIFDYYRSSVYSNMVGNTHVNKTCGDGIMGVTVNTFESWALMFYEKFNGRDVSLHDLWVFPAPCCAARFLNYNRYLPVDSATFGELENNRRSSNARY